MINPLFLKRVISENGNLQIIEDQNYHVTSYSQFGNYTLVQWLYNQASEGISGETLWLDLQPLEYTGGAFDFGIEEPYQIGQRADSFTSNSRRSLLADNTEPPVVPKSIGIGLRDPANQTYLEVS